MKLVLMICLSVYAVYFLIMLRFSYSYIAETKERLKKSRQSHNELYDHMSFEEQQLQYHYQGNLFNLPPNLLAALIYKLRHRQDG